MEALRTEAFETLYGGQAGGGKLLALGTPLPTPDGWTVIGAIRAGDVVFDDCGRATTVLVAHSVEETPIAYRLTFDDGSQITAGAEHKWLTFNGKELAALTTRTPEYRARRRAKRPSRATGNKSARFTAALRKRNIANPPKTKPLPEGTVRTTAGIAATLRDRRGRTNHAIPVAGPLKLPKKELLIDSYLLGAWLGDGSSKSGGFTGVDPEIWEEFEKVGFTVTHGTNKKSHHILALVQLLREVRVYGNKHIPAAYLRASKAQRLALLQGLMDTDGTVTDSGAVEFTNTNRELANNTHELILSLGWKARLVEGRAMLYDKDCGPKFDIKWTPSEYVFRLPRKRNKQRLATRRTTTFRYIVGCELVEPEPMRCISVDSPSHLYLAGTSFIPTHNSDLILGLARTQHTRSLLLRRTYTELEDSLISRSLEFYGDKKHYNQSKHIWHLPDGKEVRFRHLQHEKDVEDHKSAQYDLIGFDELTGFTQFQYVYLLSRARTTKAGQRVRVVAGTNPGGVGNDWVMERWAPWLDEGYKNPAEPGELRWFRRDEDGHDVECEATHPDALSRTYLPAPLSENPKVDPGYRARLALLPEPYRSQLMDGDWTAGLTDDAYQVIPTAWIRAAMKRWEENGNHGDVDVIGVDVARGGMDQTVLARRYGNWFAPIEKHPGRATPDGGSVAGLVSLALADGGIANIDVIGVGSSAYDASIQAGLEIYPVNFAAGTTATDASGTMKMVNKRAEFYWRMREALDPKNGNEIALPNDPELLGDLRAPRWKMQSNGIQIESKDAIKKRIGRSPDCADAVVLAMEAIMPAMVMI